MCSPHRGTTITGGRSRILRLSRLYRSHLDWFSVPGESTELRVTLLLQPVLMYPPRFYGVPPPRIPLARSSLDLPTRPTLRSMGFSIPNLAVPTALRPNNPEELLTLRSFTLILLAAWPCGQRGYPCWPPGVALRPRLSSSSRFPSGLTLLFPACQRIPFNRTPEMEAF
jgi:hypothetical protein